ncbi:hypothetical protein J7L13_00935 [bacterium]|nr:hypothetical protein [bacterium]
MSELTTPLQSALSDIKTMLEQNLQNAAIYEYWPPQRGLKLPAVSIFLVSSRQEEIGIGQRAEADKKAVLHVFTFQLDVWGRSPGEVVQIADQIKVIFFRNRNSFGNYIKDIVKVGERWHGLERTEDIPGTTGENQIYRHSLDFRVTYAITESLS